MDPLSARISQLSKDLERQDALARSLREEVETLEQLQSAAAMDAAALEGEHGEDVAGRQSRMPVPDDWKTQLYASRDALALAQAEFRRVRAEEEQAYALAQRTSGVTAALTEQLSALFAAANWKPGARKGYVCPIALTDDVSRAKKQLVDLYAERATAESVMRQQQAELERLTTVLSGLEHVAAEAFYAREEVKIKQLELRAVTDEARSLERLLDKKSVMASRLESRQRPLLQIRGAEGDKRVAQKRSAAHEDAIRKNANALRARALQILRLEERLDLIGEAIRGDDGEDVERVPAEELEALRKDVDALVGEARDNDKKMALLDADQEDLEARVRALTRATTNVERERVRVRAAHNKNVRYLDKQLAAQAKETAVIIEKTEKQVGKLRSSCATSRATSQPAAADSRSASEQAATA